MAECMRGSVSQWGCFIETIQHEHLRAPSVSSARDEVIVRPRIPVYIELLTTVPRRPKPAEKIAKVRVSAADMM